MRNQFLYGRKKAGYCQVNDDYPVTDKKTLLQLSSMQNYNVAVGLDIDNLPEEYYAYSERIDGEKVWIEGKTTFVPAGTSEESGTRDTSMVHKIIFSGEDYNKKLLHPISEVPETFCSTVDDYLNGSGKPVDATKDFDYAQLYDKFGLDDEKMKDFIICCLEVFPNIEKRVYCYLPTADREGSIWAKRLMEMIIGNVPACVVSGAGFTTYSPSFHSVSSNPIPGSISVIFIPDTDENRMNERSEKRQHYVFDFMNYQKQSKIEVGYVEALVDSILRKMKKEDTDGEVAQRYQKMNEFVNQGYAVDIKFLGAYMVHLMRDRMMAVNNSKFRRTLAMAIHDMLQYEEALTNNAKREIQEVVEKLLSSTECAEEDFEWIDVIYKGGELCKDIVIQYLCNCCLNYTKMYPKDQNQKILYITNYEYEEEELNDYIIEMLYSQEKYFPVGKRLVYESLNPLTLDVKKTSQKKIDMLCSYIKTVCKEYYEFAVSVAFREEIEDVFVQCLQQSDDMLQDFQSIIDKIGDISDRVYTTYSSMLQKLAFLVLDDFVKTQNYKKADNEEFACYAALIEEWELHLYESTQGVSDACSNIRLMKKEASVRKVRRVFASKDETKLLRELKKYSFQDAVVLCKGNAPKIDFYLEKFAQEMWEESTYRDELYKYFYATGFIEVMEEILLQISQNEGLEGLQKFAQKAEMELTDADIDKSSRVITKVLKKNPALWESKKKISWEDEKFLEKYGIEVEKSLWLDDKKKKKSAEEAFDEDWDSYVPKKDVLSEEEKYQRDLQSSLDDSEAESAKKKKGFSFFGGSKRK